MSTVLEASMVMGWFVVLVLGEKAVSDAASARRLAEDAAQQSATASTSSYCAGGAGASAALGAAKTSASIVANGKPDVGRALAMTSALGLGSGPKTFGYYVLPMQNARVTASQPARGHMFVGERALSCLERPLDSPLGSIPKYRAPIWVTNLMGY